MTRHYLRFTRASSKSKEFYGFTDEYLRSILKDFGAKNVRTAYENGWQNQERVLTFNLDPSRVRELEDKLPHQEHTGHNYFYVHEKDWK